MKHSDILTAVIFTTIIILILVSVVVASIIISAKQRLRQQMKISQLAIDYEKELRFVESEVSEKTMEHIAKELHDNIGHTLVIMRLHIETQQLNSPERSEMYEPLSKLLTDSLEQVRLLSRSMNTDYVTDIGLEEALRLEIQRIKTAGKFEIELKKGDKKYQIDRNRQLMIIRITQELLSNAIKHAAANKIDVSIMEDEYLLKITDNGKGFNSSEIIGSVKASGLRNIQKRADLAGMNISVDSSPGNGSEFVLSLKEEMVPAE